MAAATANPAFAGERGTVDIEAGLRDGSLTTEQAFSLQERRLRAEMEAREKQLRVEMKEMVAAAQLGAAEGGATLAAAVRGLVARLTETPTNFHQATVHFLVANEPQDDAEHHDHPKDAEDAAIARAPLMFAGSVAMVLLQSITAMGVLIGTALISC